MGRGEGSADAELLAKLEALFAELSRAPDLEAPELRAFDAADELILMTGAAAVHAVARGELAVIGDRHGALTIGAAELLGARGIRTHQDPLLGERALARNAERLGLSGAYEAHALDADLLRGARVVLLQLPRSLDELHEIAWSIAQWAAPEVTVYAGGRAKHMTRSMNDVLARSFTDVTAGLGWRKSRVITATGALPASGPAPSPRWGADPDLSFRIAAHGATFGGPTLDHGSRLLLSTLGRDAPGGNAPRRAAPRPSRIVDLGCGNGSLAVFAALSWPEAQVIATDQSAAAVAATRLTAEAAGVADRVDVHRGDALEAVPDGWAELILLNPPFHTGATVHAGVAHRLIRACGAALVPGGEARIVFNSHLRYRSLIERTIGPVRELARNRTFTVLAATKGP
ncbi:MAG: methyltransferase [Leucobacter sp.]